MTIDNRETISYGTIQEDYMKSMSLDSSIEIEYYNNPLIEEVKAAYEVFSREATQEFNDQAAYTEAGKDEMFLNQCVCLLTIQKVKYDEENVVHKLILKNVRHSLASHLKPHVIKRMAISDHIAGLRDTMSSH